MNSDSVSSELDPGAEIFQPGITRQKLEREILPEYVGRARWFGGKARRPKSFIVLAAPALGNAKLLPVRIEYADGATETYLVPLQMAGADPLHIADEFPHAVAARTIDGGILFDAIHDEAFRLALYSLAMTGGTQTGSAELVGLPGHVPQDLMEPPPSRVLAVEQSNSSVVYGDRVFLKLYRRLEEGMNPDAEILRYLSNHGFTHAPPFFGAVEFRSAGSQPRVLALALGMVRHEGDAWTFALAELESFYARAFAQGFDASPFAGLSHLDPAPAPEEAASVVGSDFLSRVRQLGIRTAELHLALAMDARDPDFTPEPFDEHERQALASAIRKEGKRVMDLLTERRDALPPELAAPLASLVQAASGIDDAATRLAAASHLATARTRTHGDYHLGQVLNTGDDFVILDFEGEPARTLAERRLKRSPLRDVAGMLRSFHYAAHSAALKLGEQRASAEPLAEMWAATVSRAFLQAWLSKTAGAPFVPSQPADLTQLLEAFLLEKALYEIAYELNNRPTWVGIPLRGILLLLRGG
jgi:maltose alpha-D-glucosyltransferase / alpha-amylase